MAFVKTKKRAAVVAAQPWDLVIVDEAHHCKNRSTLNWQLVNSLQRRFMFLLSATPVQNNGLLRKELYNLLTLLAPGHLRTEADFKKKYVKRGNPRDAINLKQNGSARCWAKSWSAIPAVSCSMKLPRPAMHRRFWPNRQGPKLGAVSQTD